MKRNLLIAALSLCCSVLMFSAQPAMAQPVTAATYTYTYEYPYTLDIPAPLDVAMQVPEVAAYIEEHGADSLCYALVDYGESYNNLTHETYKELEGNYVNYLYYDWYYVCSPSGSAVVPRNRYFYVFYPETTYNSGSELTGSAKISLSSNASVSTFSPGLLLRVYGNPVCGVWYNPNTHGITVDKNTFDSYNTSDDSTYLIRFTRNANSVVELRDTTTYQYSETLYPCLVGMKDSSFDVTSLYTSHVMFRETSGSYGVMSLSAPYSVVNDLSQYTFAFEFGSDLNSVLLNVQNAVVGVFDFVSDVVILLSENALILILLCIPLVGLTIGVFKRFTGR